MRSHGGLAKHRNVGASIIAALAVVTLSGCGGGSGHPSATPSGSSTPPQSTAATHIGYDDNGKVVDVAVGQHVVVSLPTTNWTFKGVSNSAVLRQDGPQVVEQGPQTCRALRNCGSVTLTVTAVASGTAIVSATREKCGELVFCQGAAGRYAVTVRIG